MALRKMLGDIHSKECQELMDLIASQSHNTLMHFAIHYVKDNYLSIYQDELILNSIAACEDYLTGNLSKKR